MYLTNKQMSANKTQPCNTVQKLMYESEGSGWKRKGKIMRRKAFTAVAAISMAMMMMSQAAADDNVIKIGIFEPLTGENGGGGTQEAQAADYANEVITIITTSAGPASIRSIAGLSAQM